MPWPSSAVATGELITAAQLNGLPVKVADTTLSAAAATIDFSSIPSHYAHLMFIAYLRGDTAATQINVDLRFNNDSSALYDSSVFTVRDPSTVGTLAAVGATALTCAHAPAASAPANAFTPVQILIPHYTNAANHKTVDSRFGMRLSTLVTGQYAGAGQGTWTAVAAVNRVTLLPSAGNFAIGSRVTLYGLPG